MSSIRKVTTNTLWQVASKATNSISGLIIIALITRHFGEQGVGLYTLVLGYLSFFFMPVDFGLNAIAVKHLLDQNRSVQKVFGNLLALRLTIGVAVTTIAFILIWFLPFNSVTNTGYSHQAKLGVSVQILTILAQAILATTNAYFQANHKYKFSFIANGCAALANTMLIATLVLTGFPLIFALAAFTLSGFAGATSAILLVRSHIKKIQLLYDPKYWKELLSQTLPLTISIILNLVYFRVDSLLLPFYRHIEEVGHYNIAYKIFDTLLVLPNYFSNAIYPLLLEKYSSGVESFTKLLKKSLLGLAALSLTSSASMYLLAPLAVQILLGHPNYQTTLYLQILSSGLILFFLSSLMTLSLIILNRQKYLSYIYASTMLINIALNLFLIPIYGALASSAITIATELLVLILTSIILYKTLSACSAKTGE